MPLLPAIWCATLPPRVGPSSCTLPAERTDGLGAPGSRRLLPPPLSLSTEPLLPQTAGLTAASPLRSPGTTFQERNSFNSFFFFFFIFFSPPPPPGRCASSLNLPGSACVDKEERASLRLQLHKPGESIHHRSAARNGGLGHLERCAAGLLGSTGMCTWCVCVWLVVGCEIHQSSSVEGSCPDQQGGFFWLLVRYSRSHA